MIKSSSLILWMRQQYDKALLLGALIILLISAVILILIATTESSVIRSGAPGAAEAMGGAQPLKLDYLAAAAADLAAPAQLPDKKTGILASELRAYCVECGKAIPFDATVCVFCQAPQPEVNEDRDGDGIPDEWELANGLNPEDPSDAHLDSDGDGFTNLEEYIAKMNPKDAASAPPIVTKLRVDRLRQDRFMLRFEAVQQMESGERYQLNAANRTYFSRIGETIEGYTLDRFDKGAKPPILYLKKGDRQIGLPMRKDVVDDLITVQLLFLVDGKTNIIHKDESMTLRGITLRMTEINPGANPTVKLVDAQSGAEYVIGLATPEERANSERLRRGSFEMGSPSAPATTPTAAPVPSPAVTPAPRTPPSAPAARRGSGDPAAAMEQYIRHTRGGPSGRVPPPSR